ncbi:MAG: hypothetical protein ACXAC7_00120 [Candidatus Hodarchaeales archaeon]
MLKKQFREFLKTIGYISEEELSEELLDELVNQMTKILEFDNVGNSISFKTGCLLHQLIVKNQQMVRESLEDQIRQGISPKFPALKFGMQRICLNLAEGDICKILQGWEMKDTQCKFINKNNHHLCEIIQQSIDEGLNVWK